MISIQLLFCHGFRSAYAACSADFCGAGVLRPLPWVWNFLCERSTALMCWTVNVSLADVLCHFLCFSPNSYLVSSGVFSPDYPRCHPVQLQRQVPGKVPVQRLGEVLQGSGADA